MHDHVIRVLVVDDDYAIRETLRSALQDEGYSVEEASDGEQALALLHTLHDPYVVLTDLRMPKMDGIKLLGCIADDDVLATRHSYAVITANPDAVPAAQRAARGRFAVPVLLKPFELDDVLAHVAQAGARLLAGREDAGDTRREASL